MGIVSGLAAVSLKWTVHQIHLVVGRNYQTAVEKYLFYLLPLIGILLTYIISRYVFREVLGHGISGVIYSIARKSSHLKKRMMVSRMITSTFTVGFGGSVGLEAPIAVTGSSIGANIARFMHMHYKTRTLLIACGSAAAISAIFSAPIAGVIFATEIILNEISIKSFTPLLIASVSGYVTSLLLLGDDILFTFELTDKFVPFDIPFYILLGILCGLVALYFTRMSYRIEGRLHKISNPLNRVIIGGVALGVIIIFFPPIYGEGYSSIKFLFNGNVDKTIEGSLLYDYFSSPWMVILFLLGTILIKSIATSVTIGSGGSGGIFAPSLFLGGFSGYLFSYTVNSLNITQPISTGNFTLVGMCGVMSGVLHAPLTAIFLIAEITDGYTLFVPLMLVAAIAFATISYFEPYSIYKKHLIESGQLYVNKDKEVLHLLNMRKLIEKDFKTVHPDATLGELIQLVKHSHRHIFPVVNTQCQLVGIITLDNIREMMFDRSKYGTVLIKTIMKEPLGVVSADADVNDVIRKFEETGLWNIPVLKNDIYIGFYSKSKIFSAYRERIKRQNRDE